MHHLGERVLVNAVLLALASLVTVSASFSQSSLPDVEPVPWSALLKDFVNEQHLVNYAALQKNSRSRLGAYIASLGRVGARPLAPNGREALLINAYNAFTIKWDVENYPTDSIWNTSRSRPSVPKRVRGSGLIGSELPGRQQRKGSLEHSAKGPALDLRLRDHRDCIRSAAGRLCAVRVGCKLLGNFVREQVLLSRNCPTPDSWMRRSVAVVSGSQFVGKIGSQTTRTLRFES